MLVIYVYIRRYMLGRVLSSLSEVCSSLMQHACLYHLWWCADLKTDSGLTIKYHSLVLWLPLASSFHTSNVCRHPPPSFYIYTDQSRHSESPHLARLYTTSTTASGAAVARRAIRDSDPRVVYNFAFSATSPIFSFGEYFFKTESL